MQFVGTASRDLVAALDSGDVSSVELTQAALQHVEKLDKDVRAFLHLNSDAALAAAKQADDRRKKGTEVSGLTGLPVAVKDVLCTTDGPTTCGSRMLEDFRAPYDASVIQKLRAAGAVILGKTNLDEFAMGSSTENSAFHSTANPWDLERVPGGSSGGSAAAVAAGMTPIALGTDTGGSIRQPASFCGTIGLKPTYGRVSRYGLIAYASSLDQIGPMTNDVFGAALALQCMAGHDPCDSTSIDRKVDDYLSVLDEPLKDLRIGVVREHFAEGLNEGVRKLIEQSLDVYRSLGASVEEITLPHTEYSVATYYLIAPSEASSNLARYDGIHYGRRADQFSDLVDLYCESRGQGFGDEVKRRVMLGTYVLSQGYYDAYYVKALKVRRLIRQDFDQAFEKVDVILGPTTPTPAFRLGEFVNDPLAMYLNDIYTIGGNLAGIPGISIPAGLTPEGLPVGLQLQAPPFEESRLLRAARMHEANTEWHQQRSALAVAQVQ